MTETGAGKTRDDAGGHRWQWRDAVIALLVLALAASWWWARSERREAAGDPGAEARDRNSLSAHGLSGVSMAPGVRPPQPPPGASA